MNFRYLWLRRVFMIYAVVSFCAIAWLALRPCSVSCEEACHGGR